MYLLIIFFYFFFSWVQQQIQKIQTKEICDMSRLSKMYGDPDELESRRQTMACLIMLPKKQMLEK